MDELVVTLIVILLPGILAAVIADKITVHSKWSAFKFGLYALILGVTSYASLQIIIWIWCLFNNLIYSDCQAWSQLYIWRAALEQTVDIKAAEVVFATFLAIPVAMLASWVINFKVLNRVGQWFRVTNKYGDENLFSNYLTNQEIDWVYVRDRDFDLTYQGRIMSLSENESIHELVLADVSVFRYKDSEHLYDVPSVYISRSPGMLSIEAIPIDRMEVIHEQKETTN